MTNVRMLGGHREWAPTRKVDPKYSMTWMRDRVSKALTEGGTNALAAISGSEDEVLTKIARRVLTLDGVIRNVSDTDPKSGGYYWTLATHISNIENDQDKHGEALKDLVERVKRIEADVLGPWPSEYVAPDGTKSTWSGTVGEMSSSDHGGLYMLKDHLHARIEKIEGGLAAIAATLDEIKAQMEEDHPKA